MDYIIAIARLIGLQDAYQKKVSELSKLLDVEKLMNTQVRRLSLGERMKMEVIGSILHSPKILILDEPTIGLDVVAKQTLRKFLREIQQKMGVTLLLTSHDMDDIETVCDRVIVINKGQKVYDDSLINLSHKYAQDKYVKVTFNSEEVSRFTGMEGVNLINEVGQAATYKADKKSLPALLSALGSSDVDDIDILSTPLETIIQGIFTQNQ